MCKNIVPKIIITIVVICFIGFVLSIINSFYGNPISAAIATDKIRTYVEENYPDMDLEIPKATYNFKFDEYYSVARSRTSPDTYFSVAWSNNIIVDSFDNVKNRYTTFQRLDAEFNKAVEEIILKEFPYETSILYAELIKESDHFGQMDLDMTLDIHNPPSGTSITIYIVTEDISYEFLCDRLLELSKIFEEYSIPMDMYDVVLEEPLTEDENSKRDRKRLHLFDFPAGKLSEKPLVEVVEAHQSSWEEEAEAKKE